jgi:hypothetical protein
MARRRRAEWIERRGHRTYEICTKIATFADSLGIDVHEFEDLKLDDALIDLVRPWQQKTVIHRLAERFITELFLDEAGGPYLRRVRYRAGTGEPVSCSRILTVDHAFMEHGIEVTPFDIPAGPRRPCHMNSTMMQFSTTREDTSVEDACYSYFTNDVMWSEPYETLVDLMADEVFHVLFADRGVLFAVNAFMASHIDSSCLPEAYPEIAGYFTAKGNRLRRKDIPQRAKRAVFYRDRGRCTGCDVNLSWVLDSLPREQFDHVVPLAIGGLNDITNLQLLCEQCNKTKSDNPVPPRLRYRRWIEAKTETSH